MSPQLQVAIAAIEPLSPTERVQLLQLLTHSDPPSTSQADLRALSTQFWQGYTLQELYATQTPKTFHNLNDFKGDFWTEEDSIEDFLIFLHQQRQEDVMRQSLRDE